MLLALPVAWVYLITRRKKGFTQSIVHTLIVLPVAVAGIMVLVQNSLALAFSLAGIAALRFRNTLDDTKDAVYLFVATGIGIAAAVGQLDVGLALSLVYCVAVVILWWTDVGRTPSRLKARLTLEQLRQTAELRVPSPVAAPRSDPFSTVLRVYSASVERTQRQIEEILPGAAKQWELTGVTWRERLLGAGLCRPPARAHGAPRAPERPSRPRRAGRRRRRVSLKDGREGIVLDRAPRDSLRRSDSGTAPRARRGATPTRSSGRRGRAPLLSRCISRYDRCATSRAWRDMPVSCVR
jgi:Domain of unknown function (DUF4956)